MERQKFFTAGAGSAAALLIAAQVGISPASAGPSQLDSDADVWRVRGRIDGILTQINGLSSNYNGNRVAAIASYQSAKNALDQAVNVRGMNDQLSDAILTVAISETNDLINRLNGDLGNYNGSKDQAISSLKAARQSLQAAMRR